MRRITIAAVLFLSFILNLLYVLCIVGVVLLQNDLKLAQGAPAEIAAHFNIPVMYLLLGLLSILMQLVMVLSFSNSMRFSYPTLWIEVCGCIMFGGVFRTLFHLIPSWEGRFSQFLGTAALQSREMVNAMIKSFDWMFFLASTCFLVGAGMTICFKKFVRRFVKTRDD